MSFEDWMRDASRAFELAGVAILVVGSVLAFVRYLIDLSHAGARRAYEGLRSNLGRAILLGLEILIVADIIRTITVEPTVANAATLGVIVLVRTFLSFSLEIELEGTLPWRRGRSDEG